VNFQADAGHRCDQATGLLAGKLGETGNSGVILDRGGLSEIRRPWSMNKGSSRLIRGMGSASRARQHYSLKEFVMNISDQGFTVHNFTVLNYVATDPLERDQTQSRRLHEPEQILSSTDPMTGREIDDLAGHPYLIDGNVTMYFETEATRQEFMEMPIDHPFHLVDNPTDEGYDEG